MLCLGFSWTYGSTSGFENETHLPVSLIYVEQLPATSRVSNKINRCHVSGQETAISSSRSSLSLNPTTNGPWCLSGHPHIRAIFLVGRL